MIFLSLEIERQGLPFSNWFLDRKKKNKTEEEKEKNQMSPPGFELPVSCLASKRLSHCATYTYDSEG